MERKEFLKGVALATGTILVGGMKLEGQQALYGDVLSSKKLPNFLIQDPTNQRNYWIKSDVLKEKYLCSKRVMDEINPNTVVFALPDGVQIPYKPTMSNTITEKPAVVLWHVAADSVYFISHKELEKYAIQGQPSDPVWGSGASYVLCLPILYSKIKELPVLMQGLLQHFHEDNTSIARYKGRIYNQENGTFNPKRNDFDPSK